MIRPGVTFALWLAIAALVLVNNMIGDTVIADRLTVLEVEWYKVLVPLPYVLMMAVIHARRCAGPKWLEAALLAALLWPPTTVLIDFLYGRLTFAMEAEEFLDQLDPGQPIKAPEVLFAKVTDEQIAEWTTRFGGAP